MIEKDSNHILHAQKFELTENGLKYHCCNLMIRLFLLRYKYLLSGYILIHKIQHMSHK